jgi:hypothetical protein
MSMSHGGGETQLTDEPLAAEIQLLGDVITVVSTHSGPLSPDEVDEVLGIGDVAPEESEFDDSALADTEPGDTQVPDPTD